MKTRLLLLYLGMFCQLSYAFDGILHPANGAFPDSIEYAKIPLWEGSVKYSLSKSILDTNVYSVELNTPEVLDQGAQGSCAGFAFGYAAMGVLSYDKYENWVAAQRSPAYLYHRARIADGVNSSGNNAPVSMTTAYSVACQYGCCSYSLMPYTVSDYNSIPNALQDRDAYMNRANGFRLAQTNSVQTYKNLLRLGYPIVVRIEVTPTFDSIWSLNGVWSNQPTTESSRGGHFICVVGYNDSTQMLKVQNSWGKNGGDSGFVWISYSLVQQGVFTHAICLTNITEGHYLSLQGPSLFCDTAVYTLKNVPAGATIRWVVTPSTVRKKAATIVRGQGTSQVTLQRGFILNGIKRDTLIRDTSIHIASLAASTSLTRPYSGNGSISAIVTFGGKSYTVRNDFSIPTQNATEKPIVNGWNSSLWYVGVSHTLRVQNCDSVPNDKLLWEVHLPGQTTPLIHSGRSVTFTPQTIGVVTVIVANMESCSAANIDTLSHRVIQRPSIRFVNPATAASSLDVTVSSIENEQVTAVVPYDGDYTLELWSELYGRVRMVNADEPTTQISLSGLPAGTYFIKLIIDNELVTTKQLIIK